jgi:hypothetical protein
MQSNDYFINYMRKNIRWRYLDALDSLRLAEQFTQPIELSRRNFHAKPLFFLTILMGHGITVPDNQLIDSIAFIDFASELVHATKKLDKVFFPPIRLAWHRSDSPFEIAAKIFEDTGFFLSGWPTLENDKFPSNKLSRREEWALKWRNENIPSEYLISNTIEDKQIKKLALILTFFRQQRYQENTIDAEKTKGLRNRLLDYMINLLEEGEREHLYKKNDFSDDQIETVNNILIVLKNIKNTMDSKSNLQMDKRSDILHLLDNESSYEGTSSPLFREDIKKGVVKTVDSIYNYSSSVGAKAQQDDNTEEMGEIFNAPPTNTENQSEVREWGYQEAAFFLGDWSRRKYAVHYKNKKHNDLVSTHGFNFGKMLTKEKYEKALKNFSWHAILTELTSSLWQKSVKEYLDSLALYEQVIKTQDNISRPLTDKEKQKVSDYSEPHCQDHKSIKLRWKNKSGD